MFINILNLMLNKVYNYNYTFLEEFWNTYNEFDNSVDSDENKYNYESVCKLLMDKLGEDKEEHKKFCMKLVRNLGCYPLVGNHYFDPKNDRCMILQYWIYNSVKNQQVSNKLIAGCFDDYKGHMKYTTISPKCDYFPFEDNYIEPMSMIILKIFQHYMKTVNDMLNRESNTLNPKLKNYICECVNIYNEMNKKYCPNKVQGSILTCSMLEAVKKTYEAYIPAIHYKRYQIPSLDNVEEEYKDKCLSSKLEVPPSALMDNAERASSSSLTVDIDEKQDYYSSPRPVIDENNGSSMSRTVSTAVGTMAGASSIVALLYKVTLIFI
ncbi:hypothetical protein PVBG_05777 [Plasmodium vivax Brazil I]|uniref:Uncharacterized protein n=1 Tax=Plasmodium vivax (strain Brazil I) TaxID=1033975 RepID=A0A0J9SME5_PLAV1|nr:hypothetical protein PVBG_05777 [Plasmodium vivax Brazil I]